MQLMETSFSSSVFSLAFVLLIFSSSSFSNSTSDEDALLAFKNGLDSTSLINNWSPNASICSWAGVSCSFKHHGHRVTALNLSGFHLRGTISPHLGNLTFLQSLDMSSNNFTGSIPSELFINIPGLQALNLSSNELAGGLPRGVFTNMSVLVEIDLRYNKLSGELPSDICSNTPKLKRLFLSGNQLSGKIPMSIYKCREMEDLRLSSNQFNGNIPNEIGNLTMLTLLSLGSNNLEGKIPSSLFNISALRSVYLGDNGLSGSIPIFNGFNKLKELFLDFNNLTGGIPKEIGYLTSLEHLILGNNTFTGHIPKQIGNLTLLKEFKVDNNMLTGELPGELGNLKSIEVIQAGFNGFLTIPPSIFNLSNLKILFLPQNQLSGSLPPNMAASLVNLEELYLHHNRLSGEIPTSITNASKLTMLELSSNSFTGSIPDFGNLRLLRVLRLWENNLTGSERFLSSLTKCSNLEVMEISDNPHMNGILPASIGNLSTSLTRFAASNCSIGGAIPSEIGKLSSLQALGLSKNKLTGIIPATVGKLEQLVVLQLFDNQLGGYIPRDLCQLVNLGFLFLNGNMLTGPIPECLGGLKSLQRLSFASNKLNSTLPSHFLNLPDLILLELFSNHLYGEVPYEIGRLRAIYWLDLSDNNFSGHIPDSIDGCTSMEFLSLSNNMLSGSIPQSLGEVRSLAILNLSNNHLSGLIPKSLELLDLEKFDVSNNQLVGEIPDRGCFANFSAVWFLNNSALCGPERFQVPSCIRNQQKPKGVDLVMKYVVPPFFAFMFVVVGILILIRRCRPQERPPTTENSSAPSSWKIVSEKEIEQGTSSFSEMNLLGRGGIGSVFKATLADGTQVAVKVFNLQVEGATKVFDTECKVLGTIRHKNLVKTLGCCSNTGFKALILAYMPNGSLDEWLHSTKNCLDLVERLKIAIDVSFALEYLHHGHPFPIAHCDIKPSNVLLDADMTAHVGDFGIAKLFDDGEAAVHTITMGTIGYAAPEFGSEGKISTSGDVYSYGILLLEMFTSKRPTDDMFGGEMGIKEWVGKALQENRISEVVAPGLIPREDQHFPAKEQCVSSIFNLAMKCLPVSPEERMNMMQVVVALKKVKANVIVEEIQKKHIK